MWFATFQIAMGLLALLILAISHWALERRSRPAGGGAILPPGSLGLPFIGESIEFFIPSKSIDIPPFVKRRTKMYGSLFKTSLAGRPVVISTDAEFNRFILLQEGKLVELWYLDAFAKVMGQDAPTEDGAKTTATGYIHKYLRSSVLNHFGPERLRDNLLAQLQTIADETLISWLDKNSVEAKHGCTAMIFNLMSKQLFSHDATKSTDNLVEEIQNIVGGFMSFPLDIPGTKFHRSLKSHKKIMGIFRREIEERLSFPRARKGDLLDHFISDMKNEAFLTDKFISYLMITLLIGGFEAVSSAMTLAMKYLSENPDVLQKLTVENEQVIRSRSDGNAGMTWKEYKSMTYTQKVINESLRLGSIAAAMFRRAIKDIPTANGFTIPKGWTIMIVQAGLHLNPEVFEDPLAFNPSRWEDGGVNVVGKHFIPFGGGGRPCAGAEYSRAFMAVFLQLLVTKYTWTKVKGGDIVRSPGLGFGGGFHIKISKKS